jgi:lysozyme
MTISNDAIDLIKRFEGCKLSAYLCPAKVATIGYGHTENVKLGDVITQQQADELLLKDLVVFERAVNNMVIVQINDNQRGALVSFAFNVGKTALKNSTLLKKLNNKDYIGSANEFMRWNKVAGKPLKGLTNRRKAEKELFLK